MYVLVLRLSHVSSARVVLALNYPAPVSVLVAEADDMAGGEQRELGLWACLHILACTLPKYF